MDGGTVSLNDGRLTFVRSASMRLKQEIVHVVSSNVNSPTVRRVVFLDLSVRVAPTSSKSLFVPIRN
jgi:hypothetical protein